MFHNNKFPDAIQLGDLYTRSNGKFPVIITGIRGDKLDVYMLEEGKESIWYAEMMFRHLREGALKLVSRVR